MATESSNSGVSILVGVTIRILTRGMRATWPPGGRTLHRVPRRAHRDEHTESRRHASVVACRKRRWHQARRRSATLTLLPSSSTRRTACCLNSSVNRRRGRRLRVVAIVDIVSALRNVSTKLDQAQTAPGRLATCDRSGRSKKNEVDGRIHRARTAQSSPGGGGGSESPIGKCRGRPR